MRDVLENIYNQACDTLAFRAHEDLLYMCMEAIKLDKIRLATEYLRKLSTCLEKRVAGSATVEDARRFYALHRRTLHTAAPYDFDSYMLFLEWNRKPNEKFYAPRRKALKQIADAMQALADGDLDELFISQPPRTGKTSLVMFYVTWVLGRDSERSNLYSAYSDTITSAFYSGCLEVINDPVTYLWHEVFPTCQIAATNAKDETINIDRKKRYPSLTCRSLYGTLNGACDCNGILISDDLIGGIEEALNKDRLASAWYKVDNNLIPRAKETAKLCWVGTRWSVSDPAGIRMDLLEHDGRFAGRRYKIINVPALDTDDHSNFTYDYGVGFTDEYYHQRRASFERNNDLASWLAQYQGEPIERSGALFDPADMQFYNGVLPEEDQLVRKYMAVDPAFGGGDFTAAPICYKYADGSVYVVDVIYSDGDKRLTQPEIVQKIIKHGLDAVQFEANLSTRSYRDEVEKMLMEKGMRINLITRPAPNNVRKEERIRDKAPEIRDMFFLDSDKRTKEYNLFMQNLYAFKISGKNKHDDAPDSLAQVVVMGSIGDIRRLEVFKRPF